MDWGVTPRRPETAAAAAAGMAPEDFEINLEQSAAAPRLCECVQDRTIGKQTEDP